VAGLVDGEFWLLALQVSLRSGDAHAFTGRYTAPPNSSHRATCQAAARSEVERGEEPEPVVGESELFEAEGGPELKHLVEGNAEDEFDVGLCGLIEQRGQNQSNASGSVAER
jgi:hypothetical protein